MAKYIPYISEEMMKSVERIFAHGPRRAKHHDQRLGQWLVNKIRTADGTNTEMLSHTQVTRILFNLENQELWDLLKGYNN